LQKLPSAGIPLNINKCQFERTQLCLLGYLLTEQSIQPNPEKMAAIARMLSHPNNIKDVRRFMGMINHLGKFSNRLASLTHPLCDLLTKGNSWTWESAQAIAFNKINNVKEELIKP